MTRVLIIEDVPDFGAKAKIALMNQGFLEDEVDFWHIAGRCEPKTVECKLKGGWVKFTRLGFRSAIKEIETNEAEVGIFDLKLGGTDEDATLSVNLDALEFIAEKQDSQLDNFMKKTRRETIAAGLCLIKQFCKDTTRKRGVIVCSDVATWADGFLESLGLPVERTVGLSNYDEESLASAVKNMLKSLQSPERDWFARGETLAESMPPRLIAQMEADNQNDPHNWERDNPDRVCWWHDDPLTWDWRQLAERNGFELGKNELTHNRLKGIANRRATSGGLLASLLEANNQDEQGFLQQLGCSEECRVALRVNGTNVQSIEDLSHAVGLRSRDSLRAGNGEWLSLKDEARLAYICLAFGGGRDVRIEATCNRGALILEGTGHELSRPFVGCFAGRNLRKCDCEKWIEGEATTLPKYAVARSGDLLNTLRVLHEDRGFTVYQLASLPMVGELEEAITITDGDMWEMLVNKATVGRCGGVYAADLTQNRTRFRISLIAE